MIGFNMIICRYAPATQLWRGRLHVMGGSKENRHTPSVDHWSIAVKDGKALEKEWRKEAPIPRGGPHRACVVMSDRLFLIGGQEGDFMPKPGSPIFKCSRRHEVVYGDAYMLDSEMKWKVLPPMPKPNSHIESSLAAIMETYHTKEDDCKRNAYMEAELQCSNGIQSMERKLRIACHASDANIDNVLKV
ncbi:unnamed protein product [Prunus armeniaca]|uniref:Galactose oxidase/kelch repeat superfamily protein n=1 Tax=Prunus armeniaca TaxID=36596 RepID=A0A6J5V1R9_PRUAR|nr:unnamed protein product [Prunus armeniaca]